MSIILLKGAILMQSAKAAKGIKEPLLLERLSTFLADLAAEHKKRAI